MMYLPPVASGPLTLDTVHHCDALTLCAALPDRSIDLILCDLPYGTTACSWDVVIPFAPMWAAFKRVIKPRGAIVLTASQPFTSVLVCSNLDWFKYEWVWEKTVGSNPLLTMYQPFRKHESILVFYRNQPVYMPQMEVGEPYTDKPRASGLKAIHDTPGQKRAICNQGTRYPSSVQRFANPNNGGAHPTQKPVALFEYLIRTYTQPGDVVFDPCCGSGTTAIAARNTGRRWICGDSDAGYAQVAKDRLATPYTPMLPGIDTPVAAPSQAALFEVTT